jgi:hypothetical protein
VRERNAPRDPRLLVVEEKRREVRRLASNAKLAVDVAASAAEELGAASIAHRMRDLAGQLEQLEREFEDFELVIELPDGEPYEAPLVCQDSGYSAVGDLRLENRVVVDVCLANGRLMRTISNWQTCAGRVTVRAMHLLFPVLGQAQTGIMEAALPVPDGVIARWIRAIPWQEPIAAPSTIVSAPQRAVPLRVDRHDDWLSDTKLEKGDRIDLFFPDGTPLSGSYDSERLSWGRSPRIPYLRFRAVVKDDQRSGTTADVYLPLEAGFLVRRSE